MLGHQFGMLTQPVARALDLDDDRMVKKAIQQRRGDDRIAKHLAPFGKAAVGGEDHGAFLIAGIDQLEEQIAAAGRDRQIADLIDHQQRGARQEADALAQLPSRSALARVATISASVAK